MSKEAIVQTFQLGRCFGDTVAVDDLTLEVYAGEVLGFLGHNGAGKTTTIRLLNGILEPTAGNAKVLGMSPVEDGAKLRRRTGVLTETPSLDERLTGRDNLAIYAALYGVPRAEVASRVDHMLTFFDLSERAGDKAGGYSKGMKQRLALARALIHEPEILFLDEPTAGLDPAATRQVHELISRLSGEQRRTVFLCTHNLNEAQRLCDRVAVMRHGKLLALGTPAELARSVVQSLRIEIEVDPDNAAKATGILRSFDAVTDVSQEDRHVLQVTGAGREDVPRLLSALLEAGVPVYRVNPQEPSLEDVYFRLQAVKEPVS
jgi:ABC-2 type transport system ATP-binding protein